MRLLDPTVRELLEGLEQNAYEIAMKFSARWEEDADNCWSVAHAGADRHDTCNRPSAIEHGRCVFSFMQTVIERALYNETKYERHLDEDGDTRPWEEQPRVLQHRPTNDRHQQNKSPQAEDVEIFAGTENIRKQARCSYDPDGYFVLDVETLPAPRTELEFDCELREGLIDAIVQLFEGETDQLVAKWMIDLLILHDGNVSDVSADLFGLYGIAMSRQRIDKWREDLFYRYYPHAKAYLEKMLSTPAGKSRKSSRDADFFGQIGV